MRALRAILAGLYETGLLRANLVERGKHCLVGLWQNISLLNLRITAVGQRKPWPRLVALQTNVLAELAILNFSGVYALRGLSGAGQRIAIAVVEFTNFGGRMVKILVSPIHAAS